MSHQPEHDADSAESAADLILRQLSELLGNLEAEASSAASRFVDVDVDVDSEFISVSGFEGVMEFSKEKIGGEGRVWGTQNHKRCCAKRARDFLTIAAGSRQKLETMFGGKDDPEEGFTPIQITAFNDHVRHAIPISIDVEDAKKVVNQLQEAIAYAEEEARAFWKARAEKAVKKAKKVGYNDTRGLS